MPTPDLRPRRAIDAPGPKLVRRQRPRIVCSLVRQHERASGAAAWGSLGAPGRPQPARPGRPGRACTVSPGLRREGRPAGVAGATKNKLRRRRMGVISPPRFFLRFFLRAGKFFLRPRADHTSGKHAVRCQSRLIRRKFQVKKPAARGGLQPPQRAPRRREVDLDDSRLPVIMLCRPGRQKQD